MAVLKKFIHLENKSKDVICLQYISNKGKLTLGGSSHLQEKIYSIYLSVFGECDGEPHFYEVIRGKPRITFNCNFKNYQQALAYMIDDGYKLEETKVFGRLM